MRSYRTVSPLPRQYATRRGGLFSVALSLRPVETGTRRTLSGTVGPWSPDFPPRPPFGIGAERPSGRLTDEEWGAGPRPSSRWGRSGKKEARICRGGARPWAGREVNSGLDVVVGQILLLHHGLDLGENSDPVPMHRPYDIIFQKRYNLLYFVLIIEI